MGEQVLVAGAGIAGLAVARALRGHDIPVVLSERSEDRSGLAIVLPGNAVTAIDRLGLGERLASLGSPTRRREYRSARDRLMFGVDEDAFWGPQARPRCVRRSDLLDLLADGLDAPVRRPLAVRATTPQDDSVRVEFGDDTTEDFGFVIGADGIRSAVRSGLPGGAERTQALLTGSNWRFMARNPGVDCWTVWTGPTATFLLVPVDQGQVYGYASSVVGGVVADNPDWLQTTFATYPAPVRQVLAELAGRPDTLYHSAVEEVRSGTWAHGRRVLIGDAAHATAPVWAQGAAMALEDGQVLADLLATHPWDQVGERYQNARRARVQHVQDSTDRFSRAAALPAIVRNSLVRFVGPRSYRSTYTPLRTPPAAV
ncbi:FAD-dependent monooxygenase [Kineosporia sp. NBRC 101731]|uniref:FAD-dependent monooxygenase n=1 Tax=Kineosporia sp. NBRC 101731 TaxID=3032199 RepID=UPI0024A155F6|nr:FAD-dependent monooxygenase [Kineosporia sp. NBRC 101731]GLY30860.1 salicylate hydroxylase [Kineosporia sp. NBRC 101731]